MSKQLPLAMASLCSLMFLNAHSVPVYAQAIDKSAVQFQKSTIIYRDDSQQPQSASEQDKMRLRLLLAQFTSLKAEFSQTIVDMQGEELQSASGELLLQKPQKLRWSVLSPDESLLIADGASVYNIDPFLEQVTILDQAPLTRSNPLMLLISDDQAQWNKVAVSQQLTSDVKIENQDLAYNIVSLDANSPIEKLVLHFSPQGVLNSLVSYDRQQQRNTLQFSEVLLNSGVLDQDFVFTQKAEFIIDDQRELPTTQ